MRKNSFVIMPFMCVMLACNSSKKKMAALAADPANGLLQEQEVMGFRMKMQYLPQDTTEWCFRLNIYAHDRQVFRNDPAQSYGVDTLFRLLAGTDTLMPAHAMRIANGNMNGLEYMVIFEKQPVAAEGRIALLFRDALFTRKKIVFPVSLQAIEKIEAIN